jgi:hypothetical protein
MAQGRVAQQLLRCFRELHTHHGGQRSKLGTAPSAILVEQPPQQDDESTAAVQVKVQGDEGPYATTGETGGLQAAPPTAMDEAMATPMDEKKEECGAGTCVGQTVPASGGVVAETQLPAVATSSPTTPSHNSPLHLTEEEEGDAAPIAALEKEDFETMEAHGATEHELAALRARPSGKAALQARMRLFENEEFADAFAAAGEAPLPQSTPARALRRHETAPTSPRAPGRRLARNASAFRGLMRGFFG